MLYDSACVRLLEQLLTAEGRVVVTRVWGGEMHEVGAWFVAGIPSQHGTVQMFCTWMPGTVAQ